MITMILILVSYFTVGLFAARSYKISLDRYARPRKKQRAINIADYHSKRSSSDHYQCWSYNDDQCNECRRDGRERSRIAKTVWTFFGWPWLFFYGAWRVGIFIITGAEEGMGRATKIIIASEPVLITHRVWTYFWQDPQERKKTRELVS